MPEFLTLSSPTEALEKFMTALPTKICGVEEVETIHAAGRVTASPVMAAEPLPPFSRSTVDGYAVHAADTFGASESLPAYLRLIGEVPMGSEPGFMVGRAECALIHTGGMLPEGADAVSMLEHSQLARPGEIELLQAVSVGENIILAGEDVQPGDEVIPTGKELRPEEIGGLLALGLTRVQVARKPIFGILSSGDEVVSPFESLQPGQVRDTNSYTLKALIEQHGGEGRVLGILPDTTAPLEAALRQALSTCAAAVITAGSSASTRDLTATVVQKMGAPGVLVHGINIKPGKPTILAVCDDKPVIGLPGNPVSALVIARLFVVPVVERLLGLARVPWRPAVRARLTVNLPSSAGREDWYPVQLQPSPQGLHAEPVFFKSNLIFNLARADGMVRIPPDVTGLAAGELVEVVFF